MAEIKIVDGAIRLPDTVKNREIVKKFLRKLIDDKGLKVKGSGKPSKNFKEFPKVYFDGELTEFRNKAGTGDLSTDKFEWGNKPARDSEKLNRKLNTASVDKVTAKDWEQKHITDWNKKDNPTGKPIKDTHPQFRRLEHRIKAADIFWKSETAKDLDFKAGDVENLIYTNPHQWKLKDAGEQTYGRNFVFDIDKNTGELTYTPRSKFTGYDFKYAKPFKGNIPLKELTKEANYAYEQFGIIPKKSFDQGRIRWNSKYSRFLKATSTLGALGLLDSTLEIKAAVDEQEKPNNSRLIQKAADLKLISEAAAIQSLGFAPALPLSAAAKISELHLRRRDKFEKNRYNTASERLANMPTNLQIRKTLPQDPLRGVILMK